MPSNVAVIITIDGPAGVGKSTVAHGVAAKLGLEFLDTGAMYRAAALVAIESGIDPTDGIALAGAVSSSGMRFNFAADPPTLLLDDREVTGRLRDPDVAAIVSPVAAQPEVRRVLVAAQRAIAAQHPRLVTEGRDQGSVVFPDAGLKIYLSADVAVRARRRRDQLRAAGQSADTDRVAREIAERDRRDASRPDSPLVRPDDAIEIDTGDRAAGEVIDEIVALARRRFPSAVFEAAR